ncbi:unnamed protein product, partial [Medioppia subpectinata]
YRAFNQGQSPDDRQVGSENDPKRSRVSFADVTTEYASNEDKNSQPSFHDQFLKFMVPAGYLVHSEGVCGDGWDLFHHENDNICYKYYPDGLGDYHTVATACKGDLNSSLPIINSQAEQDFFNKLIVKYKMIENVWLDASIKGKHIVWTDNSNADYENWLAGRPANESNCVEMLPDQVSMGKWEDISCAKKNSYICKRFVAWSSEQMERVIRENSVQITLLQNCPLPIGFIYVQLPGQADPKTLWPKSTWYDVTSAYAGQFFRAEGGDSLAFGAGVQPGDAPKLEHVHAEYNDGMNRDIDISPGVYSQWLYTGDNAGLIGHRQSLTMLVSSVEVRPRNQAVRLFKRDK